MDEDVYGGQIPEPKPLFDSDAMIEERPSDTSIIYQLSSKALFERLERNLRGDTYDYEKKQWVKNNKPEYMRMNVLGINITLSEVSGRIGKDTILSCLSEFDVEVICRDLHQNFTKVYILHWEEFGMTKTQIRSVLYLVMDMVFISLKKAQDKTFLNYLAKIFHSGETIQGMPQQKRKFLGIIPY